MTMTKAEKNRAVPVWEKALLTLDEASAYTGIGIHNLKKIAAYDDCDFILWVGNKRLFKKDRLLKYLDSEYSI